METNRSFLVALFVVFTSAGIVGTALATTSRAQGTGVGSTLTVSKSGSGSGTVTSNAGLINCAPACSDTYADGTLIILTATPDGGSQFTGWLGPCTGVGTCNFTINGATNAVATFAPAALGAQRLDIDGSTSCDALTDGLLVIRYLFGLSGAALINGAVDPTAARLTDVQIKGYLDDIKPALDIDGNGQADALTDGLLVIRYLFGLRGAGLIAGAIGIGAPPMTATEIETKTHNLCLPAVPALGNVGLDSSSAVTKYVGVSGGTLNTTDANGATYTLVIPPFALKSLTAITMVPVQSVQNPPVGAAIGAGAHFLPEGLNLVVPARFTIDLPSVPVGEFLPFAYAGDLVEPYLYPASVSTQRIEFDIAHFSGYAAFLAADDAQILGWFAPPSAVGDAALQALVTATVTLTGTARASAMANALQSWLDNKIKPDTASFLTVDVYDPYAFELGTVAALHDELKVFQIATHYAVLAGGDFVALSLILSEFASTARDAAKHAIETANANCSLASNAAVMLTARQIVAWQELARYTGAVDLDSSLSRSNVIANLCIQAAYDPNDGIDFPGGISAGQIGTLVVKAGHTIDGGSVHFDAPMYVVMAGTSNIEPSSLFAFNVAAGASAQKTFQWVPGTSEMRIDVLACLDDEYLREVCQPAYVVRGGDIEFGCQEYRISVGGLSQQGPSAAFLAVGFSNASAIGSQGGAVSFGGTGAQARSVDYYRVNAPAVGGSFQAVVQHQALITDNNPDFPGSAGSVAFVWTGGSQSYSQFGSFPSNSPITLRHNDVIRLEGKAVASSSDDVGARASYSIWLDQLPAGVTLTTAYCN